MPAPSSQYGFEQLGIDCQIFNGKSDILTIPLCGNGIKIYSLILPCRSVEHIVSTNSSGRVNIA